MSKKQVLSQIYKIFKKEGVKNYMEDLPYGDHMIQCGLLAEKKKLSPPLISACLLHDFGSFLLGEEMYLKHFDKQKDPKHEIIGAKYLSKYFVEEMTIPIENHIKAKRYLVMDPNYMKKLSEFSKVTLSVQGKPFSEEEKEEFLKSKFAKESIILREIDDEAKVIGMKVPEIEYFEEYLLKSMKE